MAKKATLVSLSLAVAIGCGGGAPAAEAPWMTVFPTPRRIVPGEGRFALASSLRIVAKAERRAADDTTIDLLLNALQDATGSRPHVANAAHDDDHDIVVGEPTAAPQVRRLLEEAGVDWDQEDPGPEGYLLIVAPAHIVIAGHDPRGTYYGALTLATMIRASSTDGALPAVRIHDWPHMRYRSAFGLELANMQPERLAEAERIITRLSELRYNMVSLANHNYAMLEREAKGQPGMAVHAAMQRVWVHARRHHMTPRVEGWARYFPDGDYSGDRRPTRDASDPTTLEGIRTTQRLELRGTDTVPFSVRGRSGRDLPVANVLHDLETGTSWQEEPVTVEATDGDREYRDGLDYVIDFGAIRVPFFRACHEGDGLPESSPRWAESDNPQTSIRRTVTSRIPDGAEVDVTFTYLAPDPYRTNKFRECLSDRRLFTDGHPENYLWRFATEPVTHFAPEHYFLTIDEYRVLGWDERCRRSRRSRPQIYADFVAYLYRSIRSRAPDATVFMWSDMLDPAHNARKYDLEGSADLLRSAGLEDVVMVPWDAKVARQSVEYLGSRGFSIMASCTEERAAQQAATWDTLLSRKYGPSAQPFGLQYTTWRGMAGFDTASMPSIEGVAQTAWAGSP